MTFFRKPHILLLFALLFGVFSGLSQFTPLVQSAKVCSQLFMNFLQLITAPIVFLSIFSTLLQMGSFGEMKHMGRKVLSYTLFTTLIAATTALILYLLINPANTQNLHVPEWTTNELTQNSYLTFFLNIVPANFTQAFLENNVIGITFLGLLLGLSALALPKEQKEPLQKLFTALFQLILKVANLIITLLPIGIWAFVTLFISEMKQSPSQLSALALFLSVIIGANLFHGLIFLPLLLKYKGISPIQTARKSAKPLLTAFLSKSSNAALPLSIQCAEKNLNIRPKVAHFSLPLCTVINMNGCAAFILATVLFVSNMNGLFFTPIHLGAWILLATLAAIGNAGVPMGCFFLSSAFLLGMGVPLDLMGIILPFYAVIDMVETALNVWSDICVTAIVDQELKQEERLDSQRNFLLKGAN